MCPRRARLRLAARRNRTPITPADGSVRLPSAGPGWTAASAWTAVAVPAGAGQTIAAPPKKGT